MTDKELKKLSRAELLEILVEQSKEMEELRSELAEVKEQLNSREIKLGKAGSIAEAALGLNKVFEAAQAAADQYLDNIRDTESLCERMRREAEIKSAEILMAAEKIAAKKEEEARVNSEKYRENVSRKPEKFYDENPGLREMMKKDK